ncbi:glycosyltransferase [Sphingomonas sp. LY160]|uniref:glycosyltransferase n=1 Tax=Sphingomonas sp. LY160 TaxID=3095342 RepID=UPI002ADEE2B3|nr:glycosyltransferase [Sphingomonas sp. LY160]MEA1073089.1 glycosyltransferase [Sphingomonas sp. LY160]
MTLDTSSQDGQLFADVTQSWSAAGGGVGTYLRHKRRHILERTSNRHLIIVPGPQDSEVLEENGRAITVTISSPKVPGSPNYRLMLRNGAVRRALERFRPNLIECQDAYNLPWAVIGYARRNPGTALVAAYCTDFPTVYVDRPISRLFGNAIGGALGRLCYRYCGLLYSRFDAVFAMSENGGAAKLRSLGVPQVDVVPLGVELGEFSPDKRNAALRRRLGLTDAQPLLIYAGRLDGEKRPDIVVDAFKRLPETLGAALLLLGDGPFRETFVGRENERIFAPGYCADRSDLAAWLASADLYVSAMADETFGISIIEAQASGLPVVGVAAGAMVDRVPEGLGLVGPVGDPGAMARNIVAVLGSDMADISAAARSHALQFSWDESMGRLFGDVYQAAIRRASVRAGASIPAVSAFADG